MSNADTQGRHAHTPGGVNVQRAHATERHAPLGDAAHAAIGGLSPVALLAREVSGTSCFNAATLLILRIPDLRVEEERDRAEEARDSAVEERLCVT